MYRVIAEKVQGKNGEVYSFGSIVNDKHFTEQMINAKLKLGQIEEVKKEENKKQKVKGVK